MNDRAGGEQYSPDGRWRWDGTQWVPTGAAAEGGPAAEESPSPRNGSRRRVSRRTVGLAGAGTFISAVAGLIGSLYAAGLVGQQPTPSPASTPTANAAAATPTATASAAAAPTVWNVVLDSSRKTYELGGYTPVDPSSTYLVLSLTFENSSSTQQVLDEETLLDLRDDAGQHYTEAQSTNSERTAVVGAGETMDVAVAYIVPDSACKFELSLVTNGAVQKSWTITFARC